MSFGGGGNSGGECWRRRAPRGDPGFVGRGSFDRIPLMVGLGVMTGGGPVALWPQFEDPDDDVITSEYVDG